LHENGYVSQLVLRVLHCETNHLYRTAKINNVTHKVYLISLQITHAHRLGKVFASVLLVGV